MNYEQAIQRIAAWVFWRDVGRRVWRDATAEDLLDAAVSFLAEVAAEATSVQTDGLEPEHADAVEAVLHLGRWEDGQFVRPYVEEQVAKHLLEHVLYECRHPDTGEWGEPITPMEARTLAREHMAHVTTVSELVAAADDEGIVTDLADGRIDELGAEDQVYELVHHMDEATRQFDRFANLAHDINHSTNADEAWEWFEDELGHGVTELVDRAMAEILDLAAAEVEAEASAS